MGLESEGLSNEVRGGLAQLVAVLIVRLGYSLFFGVGISKKYAVCCYVVFSAHGAAGLNFCWNMLASLLDVLGCCLCKL